MMIAKRSETGRSQAETDSFVILNDRGLHTRPATELVKCASRFKCNLRLSVDDMEVNAKSLLGIMTLAAVKGTEICIDAEGPDAKEAITAIKKLAASQFNIQY